MFAHRRSVALIALNHWLKVWPTNQEEADQANKMVKVAGWGWFYNLRTGQWEFQHLLKSEYINEYNWYPGRLKIIALNSKQVLLPW